MIEFWDMIIQLTSPFVICLSAYPLAQRFLFKSKEQKLGDKLVASFITGLTILMLLPYSIGIILGYGFRITSWVIYFVSIFSISVNIKTFIREAKILLKKAKNYIFRRDLLDLAFVLLVIGFLIKYTYYLLVRAVTDWDATNFYLPYAKAICFADSIPLTAFDFARFTKPMGISFLYGWIYSLSSSTFTENFRLIPLSFTFITILLIYLIAKDLCSSLVAKLAVMIYIFLPLHDSILYYCAYYPDVAFNSLILAVFYFLYRYTRTVETKYCLVGGLALGLSMLLKAQTALIFIPILFTFLPLFSKKSIRVFLTLLTPFAFLLFLIFGNLNGNLTSFLGLFTGEGLAVLVLIVVMSSLVALGVEIQERITFTKGSAFTSLKGLSIFLGASSIALVWYLRNYFTMSTFIWLSSIKEPNLQWAINVLSGFTSQTYQKPEIASFLLIILLVLLVHPILGSVWIIPKLVGIVKPTDRRKMLPVLNWVLGFFLAYILYAYSTMVTSSSFTVNPRDLLPLAPFFSIYSACGLLIIAEYFWKARTRQVALYFLAFLGFVSSAQSLLILYYPPSFLAGMCDQIAKLSLSSWKLLAHGPPEVAPNWLMFGFVVDLFSLLPFIGKKCVDFISYKKKINVVIHHSLKLSVTHKKALACTLMLTTVLMLQVVPYVALTYEFGNGDIRAFKENQEYRRAPGLYSDILPYLKDNARSGDVVLSIGAGLTGLQYKLDSVRIMDITFPDNLASMRELLESNSTKEIVTMLHDFNVRYFLLPEWNLRYTSFMEWLLNETLLLHVIWDPEVSAIRVTSGGWILFELLDTKETSVGWEEDSFVEYKFSEVDPTVIVDDNHSSFWTGQTWGSGTIATPVVSDDPLEKQKGTDSGRIVVGNGTGARWRIYHTYATKQDWGNFETISLYWYGANTGKTLSIYIDAPNSTNRWRKQITENWIGWKRLVIPLDDFIKVGSPLRSEVKEIAIGFYDEDNVSGTWYLDRVIVDVGVQDWVFTNNPQSEGLNHTFLSDGEILNFTVWGKANGFASFKYSGIPPLNTSEYRYVICRVKGTENARWLFRLFFQDGTSYDFPWWGTPTANWRIYIFDMASVPNLKDNVLKPDANLAVMTTDGKPASVYIDFYQIRSG